MYGHILVPVDLSDRVPGSLQGIAELARAHAGRVTLLHVIEQIEDEPSSELDAFYAELEAVAKEKLAGWGSALGEAGVEVDIAILRGKRVPEILQYASDRACDVIAMQTHRVDADHPTGTIGTISHQVALLAEQSVLLLR